MSFRPRRRRERNLNITVFETSAVEIPPHVPATLGTVCRNDTENWYNQPMSQNKVLAYGAPLAEAKAAMLMMHGRGASAEDILTIAEALAVDDIAYIAPQAVGNVWYPVPYSEPVAKNEPHLSNTFALMTALLEQIRAAGIPAERTFLLGFSQGACLSLEYTARHPQRFGGVFGLSGVLIENGNQQRDYPGSLTDTPIFLGCSDVDTFFPVSRVHHSSQVLKGLGATVTERIYPGMGHTVNEDELEFVRTALGV